MHAMLFLYPISTSYCILNTSIVVNMLTYKAISYQDFINTIIRISSCYYKIICDYLLLRYIHLIYVRSQILWCETTPSYIHGNGKTQGHVSAAKKDMQQLCITSSSLYYRLCSYHLSSSQKWARTFLRSIGLGDSQDCT